MKWDWKVEIYIFIHFSSHFQGIKTYYYENLMSSTVANAKLFEFETIVEEDESLKEMKQHHQISSFQIRIKTTFKLGLVPSHLSFWCPYIPQVSCVISWKNNKDYEIILGNNKKWRELKQKRSNKIYLKLKPRS